MQKLTAIFVLHHFFMRQLIIGLLGLCMATTAYGQLGGSRTYSFLNLTPSARVAALGGSIIPVADDDVSLVMMNPGALRPQMHNKLSVSTALYYAGINFGYVGYAHHVEKWQTTIAGGIQYISYGEMERMSIQGMGQGRFKAGEYAVYLSASRQYKRINYGATLKFITSSLEQYSSTGLAVDLGATYVDSTGRFMAGAVIRNAGVQLSTYTPDNQEPLPLNISVGVARQLEHLPVRFVAVFHNLQQFDIRYDDPAVETQQNFLGIDSLGGEREKTYLADKIARHAIVSAEFLLGKNLRFRVGYNHMRRQELKLPTRAGTTGFSLGFGLRISKLHLDYSMARYHMAGASHQFTLATNMADFIPGLQR